MRAGRAIDGASHQHYPELNTLIKLTKKQDLLRYKGRWS